MIFSIASFFCGICVLITVVFLWLLTEDSVCCISVSGLSSLFYDIFVFVWHRVSCNPCLHQTGCVVQVCIATLSFIQCWVLNSGLCVYCLRTLPTELCLQHLFLRLSLENCVKISHSLYHFLPLVLVSFRFFLGLTVILIIAKWQLFRFHHSSVY